MNPDYCKANFECKVRRCNKCVWNKDVLKEWMEV